MAKSKGRKKKKRPQIIKVKPENYIRKKGRSLPIKACYVNEGWEDLGMAVVTVIREKPNGKFILGFYMTDTFCLGLKNTGFLYDYSSFELEQVLEQQYSDANQLERKKIKPDLAYNIVYGAVEYAEDLGFSPHKDFKVSEYLLADVDDVKFIELEFGKDGKPLFVAGPYDDYERVMSILNKKVGQGNYDYLLPFDQDYDDDEYGDDDDELDYEEMESSEYLADYISEEEIDETREAIEDETQQENYDLQIEIAEVILDFVEGDIDEIVPGYDDDLFNDVMGEMEERLLEEDEEVLPDNLQERLETQVRKVMDRIVENGGLVFLVKDGYQP